MPNYRHQRRKEKLMALFERHGLRASSTRGQNFLLDKNQVNFIARTGDAAAGDIILEVGPGTGFLSQELAASGATILACEYDKGMARIARAEMAACPTFILLGGDILQGKNGINQEVISRLQEMLQARPGPLKCIANLPYSAGTPFAANLFASDLPWQSATYLLQLEVAQRLVAKENTKHYGSLSIKAALGGKVKIARKVPPQVFWPKPKVASAVVTVQFKPLAERQKMPWPELREISVALFNSRRKCVSNALKGLLEKEQIPDFLAACGIDPQLRGQSIPPAGFLRLAEELIKLRQ